jgi:S1-C subfamily serine protease
VRPGQWAFAVGNPRGIAKDGKLSFSVGIVSGVGRNISGFLGVEEKGTKRRLYCNMIEADLVVYGGSSGGAFLNVDGEVVGIVTAMLEPGEGKAPITTYAIPLDDDVLHYLANLAGQCGFLGIRTTDKIAVQGAIVVEILEKSPASKSGLMVGDIIVSLDNCRILSANELARKARLLQPGTAIKMDIIRSENRMTLTMTPISKPRQRYIERIK